MDIKNIVAGIAILSHVHIILSQDNHEHKKPWYMNYKLGALFVAASAYLYIRQQSAPTPSQTLIQIADDAIHPDLTRILKPMLELTYINESGDVITCIDRKDRYQPIERIISKINHDTQTFTRYTSIPLYNPDSPTASQYKTQLEATLRTAHNAAVAELLRMRSELKKGI